MPSLRARRMSHDASQRKGRSDRVLVAMRAPFVDGRGDIRNLIDAPFTSAAVIRSVPGAIRGDHYHKTDYHYCWLQRGRIEYYYRPVGQLGAPKRRVIRSGQLFYTPPMHEHTMVFTEESVLFVFARNNREQANYESDTVRVASLGKRTCA